MAGTGRRHSTFSLPGSWPEPQASLSAGGCWGLGTGDQAFCLLRVWNAQVSAPSEGDVIPLLGGGWWRARGLTSRPGSTCLLACPGEATPSFARLDQKAACFPLPPTPVSRWAFAPRLGGWLHGAQHPKSWWQASMGQFLDHDPSVLPARPLDTGLRVLGDWSGAPCTSHTGAAGNGLMWPLLPQEVPPFFPKRQGGSVHPISSLPRPFGQ